MQLNLLKPKQSLNKAYLKEKISRSAIDLFKKNFSIFLKHTNSNKGDEEHLKSQLSDFLRDTWFKDLHHINPMGKNDLIIHTGKSTSDPAGVIIEVKSITNKAEMLTSDKPNAKALHEIVLYYLRERIDNNNNEIKFLIITNIDDWYIFDANEFDKKIFRNAAVKKLYELKKTDNKDNPFFYEELRKLFDGQSDLKLEATWFQIREFEAVVSKSEIKDDNKLIAIYKLLSPVHLLKLPFANDSNSLQPKFYSELLHLIGLAEVKEGSKKLIQRKKEGLRDAGSLLENTITQLESHDKLSRLDKPSQYGETKEDRLYAVALELVITWINRILFLKLLEAQLISYHKGDRSYTFLNKEKIKDFDDLDKLFFRVLAKQQNERSEDIQKLFGKVPYLNSSLFEPTELEHQALFINGLEDYIPLTVINSTVLKDANGKPVKGSLNALDYLFEFLNAYDFSSEGSEEIQEDNKTLINASVLGLIFEKINGYKDGSFFTPGFITMYMCRETIRRAVVQKFNDVKGWDCKELNELYNKIDDNQEANTIINSLKICDPAVGSGHFLVSALNEIITIKADLNILSDREGRRLKEYQVEVVNDELVITDEDGNPFAYNPNSKESQRVQETLFHEKQAIIEGCLFGVDINPNSVKICRLRLWIELLKNAYYKAGSHPELVEGGSDGQPHILRQAQYDTARTLETLPNIDINIKTGNSLISRFTLDADLKKALKKSGQSIEVYRMAVQTYRNAKNKDQKREMERLMNAIKSNFRTEIGNNHPLKLKIDKIDEKIYLLTGIGKGGFGMMLFDDQAEYKSKNFELRKQQIEDLTKERKKYQDQLDEILNGKIYENAFEWRFEFPEVLNDKGDFVGFDIVIANPPYIVLSSFSDQEFKALQSIYPTSYGRINTFALFTERVSRLMNKNSFICLIIPDSLCNIDYYTSLRKYLLDSFYIQEIIELGDNAFEEAVVPAIIFSFNNLKIDKKVISLGNMESLRGAPKKIIFQDYYYKTPKYSFNLHIDDLFVKIQSLIEIKDAKPLKEVATIKIGICTGANNMYMASEPIFKNSKKVLQGRDINRYSLNYNNQYVNYDRKVLLRARDEEIFLKDEKLLMRQTSDRLILTIDLEKFYTIDSLFIIYSQKISLKYLLALLNSKLLNRQYQKLNPEAGRVFAQVKIDYVNEIPIVINNSNIKNDIERKASEILALKKTGILKTDYLEKEIDQLVYQLYGLTEEEIKIVEGVT